MKRTVALALAASVTSCGGHSLPSLVVRAPSGVARCAANYRTADTSEARERGLRGEARIDRHDALVLAFPVEDDACIVNTGVPFPIDVVFADDRGEVVAVESFAADEGPARCHARVRDAIELARGVASAVVPGDRVIFSE